MYDTKGGNPPPELRGAAEGLNTVLMIFTFGLSTAIGNAYAAEKRRQYFSTKGDKICAEQQTQILKATIITSLDADGPSSVPIHRPARKFLPKELKGARPLKQSAPYYIKNPSKSIRKELFLKVKDGKKTLSDGHSEIYLKPTDKDNEYITWHPHAAKPELLQEKVIYDTTTQKWRYAREGFDTDELEVRIVEGKTMVNLHNEYYELHMNAARQYEIVVEKQAGYKAYLPAYMEPLSRTWHINLHNGRAVFKKKQEKIINNLRVEKNEAYIYFAEKNNNPQYYGTGVVYRSVKAGDETQFNQGNFIEMNGSLLPVRQIVTPGHGVRYEIYDLKAADKPGYSVAWDGQRWIFERPTSVHASRELVRMVERNMFASDADANKLSAPDQKGLRWDKNERSFLQIKNIMVEMHTPKEGKPYIKDRNGKKIELIYEKKKFFPADSYQNTPGQSEYNNKITNKGINKKAGHQRQQNTETVFKPNNLDQLFEYAVNKKGWVGSIKTVEGIKKHNFKIPETIYRAHTGAVLPGESLKRAPGASQSVDDIKAAIIRHSARTSGSAGEVMSFTTLTSKADSFARQYKKDGRQVTLVSIDTTKEPGSFLTMADIILNDGIRLYQEGKIKLATLLQAIQKLVLGENEVFYIKGDIPADYIKTATPF